MNIAVIFAGGVGTRMKSHDIPKQFLKMHGKPIIIHTLELFEKHTQIDFLVVACVEEWISTLWDMVKNYHLNKVQMIVPGGTTGQLSIYNGLKAAESLAGDGKAAVLIHDGVRPLINEKVISDNIESVEIHGSAITSTPVKETLMVVNEDNSINYIPSREHSRIAKAPQSFWLKDILETHEQALKDGLDNFIDSCTMMKYYGKSLYLVDGPNENIKITTPDDFFMMRALIDAKEDTQFMI